MPHVCEAGSIETARLQLRPMKFEDAPQVHRLWTERAMLRRIWLSGQVELGQTLAAIERSIEFFETRGSGLWCVSALGDDVLVGFCGFWFLDDLPEPRLTAGVSSMHARRGTGTEMMRAILRHGFDEACFPRVVVPAGDPRARHLAEKLGFVYDRRQAIDGSATPLYVLERGALREDGAVYRLVQGPRAVLRL